MLTKDRDVGTQHVYWHTTSNILCISIMYHIVQIMLLKLWPSDYQLRLGTLGISVICLFVHLTKISLCQQQITYMFLGTLMLAFGYLES